MAICLVGMGTSHADLPDCRLGHGAQQHLRAGDKGHVVVTVFGAERTDLEGDKNAGGSKEAGPYPLVTARR